MSLSKIYKITSPNTDKIYVGSTNLSLQKRLAKHLSDKKVFERGKRAFCASYDIIDAGNYQIELIETCDQAIRYERESFYIRSLDTHNIQFNKDKKQLEKKLNKIDLYVQPPEHKVVCEKCLKILSLNNKNHLNNKKCLERQKLVLMKIFN